VCATNAQPARARYAADVPHCMQTFAAPFWSHSCTKTLLASELRTHFAKLTTTKSIACLPPLDVSSITNAHKRYKVRLGRLQISRRT
jgi:hypothetical protein